WASWSASGCVPRGRVATSHLFLNKSFLARRPTTPSTTVATCRATIAVEGGGPTRAVLPAPAGLDCRYDGPRAASASTARAIAPAAFQYASLRERCSDVRSGLP